MTNPYRAPYVLPPSIRPGLADQILSLVGEETNWTDGAGGAITPRTWLTIEDSQGAVFGIPGLNPIDLQFEGEQINDLGVVLTRNAPEYNYALPAEVGKYKVSMEI